MTKTEVNILKPEILFLGFSTIIIQLLFIKEFFSIFNGNELIFAIIIAIWMILTGLGSYLGKFDVLNRYCSKSYPALILIMGTVPFISFFFLAYLKNIIFPLGSIVSIVQIFSFSVILLAPFCLIAGFLFTYLSIKLSGLKLSNKISETYSIESIGSILGGLIFSFVLLLYLRTYQVLGSIFFLAGLIAFMNLNWKKRRLAKYFYVSFLICSVAVCFIFNFDRYLKQLEYPHQEILQIADSPYGNIVKTQYGKQINVYENGTLLFCTNNNIHDEELVHYAMVQHKDTKNVLLISGGTPGIFKEILKYNPEEIVYTEINPEIIKILLQDSTFGDNPRIKTFNIDARQFIRQNLLKFDVVLINLPPPDNFRINRYYSSEFLQLLKKSLYPGAIVRYYLPSTINYVSREAGAVNSVLYNTLKQQFKNVKLIPGELNYYIASDEELSLYITKLIEDRKIQTEYVNKFYLDDRDIQNRSAYILRLLENSSKINSDFFPVCYYKQIIFQLSQFHSSYFVMITSFLLILIFSLYKLNTVTWAVFVAGFTVSSIEVMVLFSFQIFFGYIYFAAGIFFAIFMSGLFVATIRTFQNAIKKGSFHLFIFQSSLGLLALVFLVFILIFKEHYHELLIKLLCGFIVFLSGFLMGELFSSATRLQKQTIAEISAGTYSFDLIGSALGALLIASVLIPLIGFTGIALSLFLLNLITAVLIKISYKKN